MMDIAEIRLEIVGQLLDNYPNMPTDALIDKADKISDFIANGKTDVLSDDESYKLERALAMVVQKVDIPTAMHQAKVIANFLKTGKTIGIEAFENATKVSL